MESENILLQRFASTGDAEAFSEVVQLHAGLVYGACLRVLADKNKAADAVQDTFFQLLQNAGKITGSVPAWLHKVATRKAIDIIRRDSRLKRRRAEYAARKLRQTSNWTDISPYVDEALNDLDDQMRQVLIQRFFEGKTTTDIAANQAVSQATVSRRIEAGIAKLRDKLHNRGIVVTAITLGGLLSGNIVEAAPAFILKELGKMALAGASSAAASGTAATASAATTAATASTAGAEAVVGVAAISIKAKIITAAAVTVVGLGSVVTYNQVTKPVRQPKTQTTRQVRQTKPQSAPATYDRPSRTRSTRTVVQPEQAADEIDYIEHDETFAGTAPIEAETPADTPTTTQARGGFGGARYGGGGYGGGYQTVPAEKTDSNDPAPRGFGGSRRARRR